MAGSYNIAGLLPGWYIITISSSSTIELSFSYYITMSADATVTSLRLYVTETLASGNWMAVLHWLNLAPLDLDAHLYYPATYECVKFSHRDGAGLLAHLNLDDRDGHGPETITITVHSDMVGHFQYVVYDFNQTGNLATSEAFVTLYSAGSQEHQWSVSTGFTGFYWHVFALGADGWHDMDFSDNNEYETDLAAWI
jgi:hypothetical protein